MKQILLLSTLLFSASGQATELQLTLRGDALAGTSLLVRVFDASEQFPKGKYIHEFSITAASETAPLNILKLPHGRYAIAAFADLNKNGKLDRSFIGKPSEPYGFSNDARQLFGPPDFAHAAFEVTDAPVSQTIHLH